MNDTNGNWVAVFAKRPVPGNVKTRLTGVLGREGAAELYQALLDDTLSNVRQVRDARKVIAFAPDAEQAWFAQTFRGFALVAQGEGDLGRRLSRLFRHAFQQGARRVVVVGSDLPTLTAECVERAHAALAECDVVIGPAEDGGYYLLGLGRHVPGLFVGIDWSTERVLGQTLERAGVLGLVVRLLETARDVDDRAGLERLALDLADPALEGRAPRTAGFMAGTATGRDVRNLLRAQALSKGAP